MSIFGGNSAAPKAVLDAARKIMSGEEIEEKKKLDPVGQEDGDIDNDGDKDSSDEYLMKRRKAIKKAMKTDESVEIREEMTPKDYKAQADKHFDQAKYHSKEADRHVNRDVKSIHKAAAKHHDDAGNLADEAADAISTDHSNKGDAVSDYKDQARRAKETSQKARERGAEADKRRAHVRKVDGKDVYEATLHEAEDDNVTKKVRKHTQDPDALHVGTAGHEHVYAGEQPDHETHVYYVHNTKTGKTHEAGLEHAGEAYSHDEIHKEFGGNVSKAASKIVHDDHKEELGESVDMDAGNVDKALKHDCATHVQHEEHGIGRCIPGMHTLVQVDEETGIVTHYDVMFENDEGSYIVENVPVEEMKVLKAMNHGHKKKSMGENYAGNYGSSVASYGKEKDHEKRYEKENPGKKWKDLPWGHQQSHSAEYDKNPK